MRNLSKMNGSNDGTRTLIESIMVPEIISALTDWQQQRIKCVLIGGTALSYYVKPRLTDDLDFLFMSQEEIPESVYGFKRTRLHCFQHNKTHVEIEVLTPEFIKVPANVVKRVIETAEDHDSLSIASPSGLIASKLFRLNSRDKADIIDLINNSNRDINISGFNLPQDRIEKFVQLTIDAEQERNAES